MPVKIYLCTMMLSFLSLNLKNSDYTTDKRITVIGTALNSKDAAVVQSDKGYYILDGLDEWNEKYYGKKVKVSGILKVEYHEKQSTDSMLVQERVGTWLILKKPKWSLVE